MVDDRLNPQYSVLGCMLIDPDTIGGCIQKLDDQDFTDAACRLVYQAIRRLWASGQRIDPVIVRDQLTGFDNATSFLVDLMDITPTVANLDVYIAALKKQSAILAIRHEKIISDPDCSRHLPDGKCAVLWRRRGKPLEKLRRQ